jgi:hypothetical protein
MALEERDNLDTVAARAGANSTDHMDIATLELSTLLLTDASPADAVIIG